MEEKIAKSSLFKNVAIHDLRTLLNNARYMVKKYSKNSIIVFQNDVCINFILMYTGKAVAEKINYSGKNIVVEEFTAPKVFAPAFLYNKDNRYPVSVYALETCEVILISRDEFMKILQKNSQVLFNFLEIISEQTCFLNKKLNVYKLSLKGKIADFILTQSDGSESLDVAMFSHQKLANLFGVARPSLSRAFAEMQKEKMISVENKKVRILNRQALRNIAE